MTSWIDTHGYSLAGYLATFVALSSYGYWLALRARRTAAAVLAAQQVPGSSRGRDGEEDR